jgi:hypothetical protein
MLRFLRFIFLFLSISSVTIFAQVPDATVIVHQNTLNGFLNAAGPMSGSAQYNVLGSKGTYTWTVQNAHIQLLPNAAQFSADASVKVGPFNYGSVATGEVVITYDPVSNRISVKVQKAMFEVYTKIFGKKIHIADVDISPFYKPEFEFAGPQPVQPSVNVSLPDGSTKTIYISMVQQMMTIQQDQISVTSQLKFSDQPPAK